MKSFNYLRILFLAIISLSIISCNNDDEDNALLGSQASSSIPGDGNKKLVQMNQINDDLDGAKYYFKYNENGALAEVTIFEYDEYDQILETISNNYYKWTATELFLSHDKYSYESLCEISNGRSVRDTYPNKYMYDANGYLINRNREGNDETYTWKEGRLMSYVFKYDGGGWGYTKTLKYIYSPNSNKMSNGFFPNIIMCNDNYHEDFFSVPWVIGMEQQDLPQEIEREYITWSNAGGSSTLFSKYVYDYTFYDDGYLKSCTERELGETYSYTTVYEYFWE